MTFGNRKFAGFLGAATVVIIAEYILVLSDCVISGRVLGETALGAMNLLMPVFSTVSFFTWLLAVGTSIVYSQAMGRTRTDLAQRLAGQGLLAAVVMGLLLVGVTWLLENPYLTAMAPDPESLVDLACSDLGIPDGAFRASPELLEALSRALRNCDQEILGAFPGLPDGMLAHLSESICKWGQTVEFAGKYWDWYPIVVIFESVDLVLLYLIYTDGGEIACLFSYVGQVVVNIFASYWLCSFTDLDMAGISLGTLLAYVVGILALLPWLFSSKANLRFRFAFLPRRFLRSLQLSFGDASAGLFHALLFLLITKYVLFYWGAETLPITAVVFCIVRLTVFFNGVGIALQPLETVYHGEGNSTAIAKLVRFAAAVSIAEGILLSAIVFIAPELVIGLVGITDPALVEAARRAARLTVTGLSGYAIAYMLNSHFQYVGRPGHSVKLTALAFFVLPAALVLVLGSVLGMDGVWIAIAAGPACALASVLPFWLRRTGDEDRPVMWEVSFEDESELPRVISCFARELAGECSAERIRQMSDDLLSALSLIRGVNAEKGRAVHAEVTLKWLEHGYQVIVRDDGEHIAVAPGSAEVAHIPVTGFNRNILTWARREGEKGESEKE